MEKETDIPVCIEEECSEWDCIEKCCTIEPKMMGCPYWEDMVREEEELNREAER